MAAILVLPELSVYACSTPVFRYAMERWPADYYDGVLIHKGPLAENDPASVLLQDEKAEFLNLRLFSKTTDRLLLDFLCPKVYHLKKHASEQKRKAEKRECSQKH